MLRGQKKSGKLCKNPACRSNQTIRVNSIPSKYETICLNEGHDNDINAPISLAFGSTSNRFDAQISSSHVGPGCYFHIQDFEPKSDSFSHKGYTGGFVSRTKRFKKPKRLILTKHLGPGLYYKPVDYTNPKNHISHAASKFLTSPRWRETDTELSMDDILVPSMPNVTIPGKEKANKDKKTQLQRQKLIDRRPSSSFASKTVRFQHKTLKDTLDDQPHPDTAPPTLRVPRFSEFQTISHAHIVQQSQIHKENYAPFGVSGDRLSNKQRSTSASADFVKQLSQRNQSENTSVRIPRSILARMNQQSSHPNTFRAPYSSRTMNHGVNKSKLNKQRPSTATNLSTTTNVVSPSYDISIHETFIHSQKKS